MLKLVNRTIPNIREAFWVTVLIVVAGCSATVKAQISYELDTLAIFRATEPNTDFGRGVVPIGDQNDDGYDDIIVWSNPPRIFLFHGGTDPDTLPVFVIDSVNLRMNNIGDVDGDGFPDLAAQSRSNYQYKLGLYMGGPLMDTVRDAWFGWDTLTASPWSAYGIDFNHNGIGELATGSWTQRECLIFDLDTDVDSIPEMILRPFFQEEPFTTFAEGLITGDFNGDNEIDLLVSLRPQPAQHVNGSLYLYLGGPSGDTIPDMVFKRRGEFESGFDEFGILLVNILDINGDGFEDFFAAAGQGLDTTAFVYFGGPSIDTVPDLILPCNPLTARRGGDLNNDGYQDLLISHPLPWSGIGWVYIYFGGPAMDSIPDVELHVDEFPGYQTYFGNDCPGVGDFNGDGIDDFAISMIGTGFLGTVYVFSGWDSTATDVDDYPEESLPEDFSLAQNYPNPFNPATTIEFTLPERSRVNLVVYNVLGREVATLVDENMPAGTHRVDWNGTNQNRRPVASGVYLYRLTTGNESEVRKMLLLK